MSNRKAIVVTVAALSIAMVTSGCESEATSSAPPASVTPAQQDSVASASDAPPATADVQTIRIPVEGMSCVACAARVKKTLVAIPGVQEVEVHLGERNARVRFDSRRVSSDRLVAVINELGYSASKPIPSQTH